MSAPAKLRHLALDTAQTTVSSRDELSPAGLAEFRPLTRTGYHDLAGIRKPGAGIHVAVHGSAALVTVFWDQVPLVTFAVAADDAGAGELWPLLSQPAAVVPDYTAVPRPSAVPWLAARPEERGAGLYPDAAGWLGDFERCWAWAWLAQLERARLLQQQRRR